MIIGLLNLYGASALTQKVLHSLESSGLLAATASLYYTHTAPTHPRSGKVKEEIELYACAQQYPTAYVWSFNVKDFAKGTPAELDWCNYELYFLIEHWQRAVVTLEVGYDSYGVNLHAMPEPHYEGYCFWMKGSALANKMEQPYCAFQSFTNHYHQPFPASQYTDCDWSQSAPLSSRIIQNRLQQLPEEQRDLSTLMLLLLYSKNHYDPVPFQLPKRPYVIVDKADSGVLAVATPGLGRIDCTISLPLVDWHMDFNFCEQVARGADIIYTTTERADNWISFLAGQGVIVVPGHYYGNLPSQMVGNYTLVAREPTGLKLH